MQSESGTEGAPRADSARSDRQAAEPVQGWRRLLPERELPAEGAAVSVEVEGRRIAVIRAGGEWHALDDACPHQGAPLSCGVVAGGEVTCSWHGWHFDLASGRSTDGLDARVAVHPVRRGEGGWLEIRLDAAPGGG